MDGARVGGGDSRLRERSSTKAAFAEAWEAGAKLSLDEAVALALGEADEASTAIPDGESVERTHEGA